MPLSIEQALEQACALIVDTKTLVRVVLSGRRRNMQVEHERIDIRAVEIKGSILLQLTYNDGKATTTKNINDNDSEGGYKYREYNNIRVRNAASWMMDAMETSDDIRGTYERLLVTVVIYI